MAMITTIYGEMDESQLVKSTGTDETIHAFVDWVEYRLPDSDEIIHRSAHANIKQEAATAFAKGELF